MRPSAATGDAVTRAETRLREIVQRWFLTDPVLFGVLITHRLVANTHIVGLRVGGRRLEYNPVFVLGLRPEQLREALHIEAMRILLLHPYERKKPIAEAAYLASNLVLGEHLAPRLPLPRASEVFHSHEHDRQYYEYYYELLVRSGHGGERPQAGLDHNEEAQSSAKAQGLGAQTLAAAASSGSQSVDPCSATMTQYDPQNGSEATALWGHDELAAEEIADVARQAQSSDHWGTVPGSLREQILANLCTDADYRSMLRAFRASVLSSRRVLTRMRPNRRYEFEASGSRREFSTKLLLALDVSGSMSQEDLAFGCGVVRQLFRYGIEELDVLAFDTRIQGAVSKLRRAQRSFTLTGRGGTNFDPVMRYVEEHPGYDGLIVFTDGFAPVPRPPSCKGKKTRVFWLFTHRETYERMSKPLAPLGRAAHVKR